MSPLEQIEQFLSEFEQRLRQNVLLQAVGHALYASALLTAALSFVVWLGLVKVSVIQAGALFAVIGIGFAVFVSFRLKLPRQQLVQLAESRLGSGALLQSALETMASSHHYAESLVAQSQHALKDADLEVMLPRPRPSKALHFCAAGLAAIVFSSISPLGLSSQQRSLQQRQSVSKQAIDSAHAQLSQVRQAGEQRKEVIQLVQDSRDLLAELEAERINRANTLDSLSSIEDQITEIRQRIDLEQKLQSELSNSSEYRALTNQPADFADQLKAGNPSKNKWLSELEKSVPQDSKIGEIVNDLKSATDSQQARIAAGELARELDRLDQKHDQTELRAEIAKLDNTIQAIKNEVIDSVNLSDDKVQEPDNSQQNNDTNTANNSARSSNESTENTAANPNESTTDANNNANISKGSETTDGASATPNNAGSEQEANQSSEAAANDQADTESTGAANASESESSSPEKPGATNQDGVQDGVKDVVQDGVKDVVQDGVKDSKSQADSGGESTPKPADSETPSATDQNTATDQKDQNGVADQNNNADTTDQENKSGTAQESTRPESGEQDGEKQNSSDQSQPEKADAKDSTAENNDMLSDLTGELVKTMLESGMTPSQDWFKSDENGDNSQLQEWAMKMAEKMIDSGMELPKDFEMPDLPKPEEMADDEQIDKMQRAMKSDPKMREWQERLAKKLLKNGFKPPKNFDPSKFKGLNKAQQAAQASDWQREFASQLQDMGVSSKSTKSTKSGSSGAASGGASQAKAVDSEGYYNPDLSKLAGSGQRTNAGALGQGQVGSGGSGQKFAKSKAGASNKGDNQTGVKGGAGVSGGASRLSGSSSASKSKAGSAASVAKKAPEKRNYKQDYQQGRGLDSLPEAYRKQAQRYFELRRKELARKATTATREKK